jgi:hypothetical protein
LKKIDPVNVGMSPEQEFNLSLEEREIRINYRIKKEIIDMGN